MVVHFGKLATHLRGHKGMGDMVRLEIIVQSDKVQTNLLRNDIDRSTCRQRRIHIHHTGIKTIAGIGSHVVTRLQVIVAAIPVAEHHQIPVLEHHPLRHARRARGIEQDEKIVGLYIEVSKSRGFDIPNVFGQQHLALILVDDGSQLLVGYQHLRIGILHHEAQALSWITGVQRLVGTACLQHTQRGNSHPLTTGNQNRDDILNA